MNISKHTPRDPQPSTLGIASLGFQSRIHTYSLLLLLPIAAATDSLAGCDGLGGSGGGCGGGGGPGPEALLMYSTNATSATVIGVDGLIFTGVAIPATYRGLPVTSIGPWAFAGNYITSVTIPDSVTNIGVGAFANCYSLEQVQVGQRVSEIAEGAFWNCFNLASITVPRAVAVLGNMAFSECYSLFKVHFDGNAPGSVGTSVFENSNATVYRLPGTTGWTFTFAGRPTAYWHQLKPLILPDTIGPAGNPATFGFTISWTTNIPVVVEACSSDSMGQWSPLSTNKLVNGAFRFNDPDWMQHPSRTYRVRSR